MKQYSTTLRLLLGVSLFFAMQTLHAQDIHFETVQDSILHQLALYPQEKVHLHLDRNVYVPGEKIWFKAYLADALTHIPTVKSKYIYVELINASDSLVQRVKIRPDSIHQQYYGHLFLADLIPEGNYTIRAYTRFMENLGPDYFFNKNIFIGQLTPGDDKDKDADKKKKQSKPDYDISFFPEGGNLLIGEFCRVAFKALDETGAPESITAKIVDKEGNALIEDIKTAYAGMGSFMITPQKDNSLFLECTNEQGLQKRFPIPQGVENAHGISVTARNKNMIVSVKKSTDTPVMPYFLLAHIKGAVLYFNTWDNPENPIIFSSDDIPSGIVQFILLDKDLNPLSERLVFNKNNDHATVAFSTDKAVYETRDKVVTTIAITDGNNRLSGDLSVSITDDNDIEVDTLHTILSNLLLSSELKGYIEDPGYYLQNNNQAAFSLDLLMLTHGWRRYNIPEVIKGRMEIPEIPYETAQHITGAVKGLLLGKAIENSEIYLHTSTGDIATAEANERGEFMFIDFEFPDSTKYFINALGKKGRSNVELTIQEEVFPKLSYIKDHKLSLKSNEEDNEFLKKAEQRTLYDEDMRMVLLPEVTITGRRRIAPKDEARLTFWANSSSDFTMYGDEIEKRRASGLKGLLATMGGVRIDGSNAYIRGNEGPALIVLDGLTMEGGGVAPLDMIIIDDVESIDLFRGVNANIFGAQGANGVISITTKRGNMRGGGIGKKYNFAAFEILGHQKPVEFYAPKYDNPNSRFLGNPDFRTTIFWKPDVWVVDDEKTSFEFYTSDFPATYSVVIEGLTTEGKIVRSVEKITVRK